MKMTNDVYNVPCGACDKEYIGQTSQFLEKRLKQHQGTVRANAQSSGLAQHSSEHGHPFDFSRTTILEKVEKDKNRLTAEMLSAYLILLEFGCT